jgi:Fe-S cluster biosynthesis and repair protein YggX
MPDETTEANVGEEGARVVMCVKLGRILPGLENPPFPGELGERIFNQVSQLAWQMWLEQQVLLINHYGLNLADPAARAFLTEQTEEFFFGEGAQMPEGWTPEGTPGAGEKGGGVQQKK